MNVAVWEYLRVLFILAVTVGMLPLLSLESGKIFAAKERYYVEVPAYLPKPDFDFHITHSEDGTPVLKLELMGIVLAKLCSERPGILEAHAHLFIDGRKYASLYEGSLPLAGIDPGVHEFTVSVNQMPSHRVYTYQGVPLSKRKLSYIPHSPKHDTHEAAHHGIVPKR